MRRGIAVLVAGLLAARAPGAQGAPPTEGEALALFRDSCVSCHAPPDLRFAVDRAWLAQVADTA